MRNKTIPAGKIGLGASLALLSGGAAQAAKPARQSPKRPNIVLVIADDCRHYDLGCYGSPDAITPNIDRLAAQGLRFERFFQATAMSSPTRHCLLTGLYPVRSGAYPNHTRLDEGRAHAARIPQGGRLPHRPAGQAAHRADRILPVRVPFGGVAAQRTPRKDRTVPGRRGTDGRTVLPLRRLDRASRPVDARRPQPLEPRRPHAARQPRRHARNAPAVPQLPRGDQRAGQPGGRGGLPAPQIRTRRKHRLHLHQRAGLFVPVRQVDLL